MYPVLLRITRRRIGAQVPRTEGVRRRTPNPRPRFPTNGTQHFSCSSCQKPSYPSHIGIDCTLILCFSNTASQLKICCLVSARRPKATYLHSPSTMADSAPDIVTLENLPQTIAPWNPRGESQLYAVVDMGRCVFPSCVHILII